MSRNQHDLARPEPHCENAIYLRLPQSQGVLETFFEDGIVPTDPLAMGGRIFEIRKALGTPRKPMPLAEFAAQVAARAAMPLRSASTVSRWELDDGVPTPAEALAIAELGGVRYEWLVRGEEPRQKEPNHPVGLEPPNSAELKPAPRPEKPQEKRRRSRDD